MVNEVNHTAPGTPLVVHPTPDVPLTGTERSRLDRAAVQAKALHDATVICIFRGGKLQHCDVNKHHGRVP